MQAPRDHQNHCYRRPDLRRDPPPQPESSSPPEKPTSKLLNFFLKAVAMIALTSCFFLLVGFGSILLLLLFKLCPASRRLGRFPNPDQSDDELSPEDLLKLPRVEHSCGAGGGPHGSVAAEDECVVCLSNSKDGDWCRILPGCDHKFHADCMDRWLVKASVCPICRRRVRLDGDSIEGTIGGRKKSKELWINGALGWSI